MTLQLISVKPTNKGVFYAGDLMREFWGAFRSRFGVYFDCLIFIGRIRFLLERRAGVITAFELTILNCEKLVRFMKQAK